jgi:hypothetical protein
LKTFLPDGDVDLTALIDSVVGDALVNDVRCILESEESNIDAELEVKDVKFIEAEVYVLSVLLFNLFIYIYFLLFAFSELIFFLFFHFILGKL